MRDRGIKERQMRRQTINRIIFYITGLLILAMGLTLNTKAGLGVSPIISVSYSISQIMGMNFGNTTMGLYCVFVVVELILHFIRDRRSEKTEGAVLEHANRMNRKLVFLMDVLQIPLSMIFTRFLNLFAKVIPDFSEGEADGKQYAVRFAVLILALILTGIGAAMSLNMRIIPNPGDGIVQAIADCIHKSVGFTKNCFDVFNVTVNKGQAIIANDNASVTATANIGADASELEKLIAAVRDKIGTIASDEDKEAASESLEVIEAEVVSEKPKKSMIKTAIATLQAIKGTVEFGSAAAALIQFIGPMLP